MLRRIAKQWLGGMRRLIRFMEPPGVVVLGVLRVFAEQLSQDIHLFELSTHEETRRHETLRNGPNKKLR